MYFTDYVDIKYEYSREGLQKYFELQEQELKKEVEEFKRDITLTIFTSNEASLAGQSYINNKVRIAERVGIKPTIIDLSKISESDQERAISNTELEYIWGEKLGGMIIQLPTTTVAKEYIRNLNPFADADCIGHVAYNDFLENPKSDNIVMPCTARGIIRHMEYVFSMREYEGSTALVAGRSRLVGEPLAKLLRDRMDMTVINVHSKSLEDVSHWERFADIAFIATNKVNSQGLFGLSTNAPCYDITMGMDKDGRLAGACYRKYTKCCTPTIGGVGPMTCYELMRNCIKLAKQQRPF